MKTIRVDAAAQRIGRLKRSSDACEKMAGYALERYLLDPRAEGAFYIRFCAMPPMHRQALAQCRVSTTNGACSSGSAGSSACEARRGKRGHSTLSALPFFAACSAGEKVECPLVCDHGPPNLRIETFPWQTKDRPPVSRPATWMSNGP